MLSQCFGRRCRRIVIQTGGHSVSGSLSNLEASLILTRVCAETTSFASPDMHDTRVVLRKSFVKDDTSGYAVFTEQGASATHMNAVKVLDTITLPTLNVTSGGEVKTLSVVNLRFVDDVLFTFTLAVL